jgi:hypothetical protein
MFPPDTPGLGVELRRETIDKYPYREGVKPVIRRTTGAAR